MIRSPGLSEAVANLVGYVRNTNSLPTQLLIYLQSMTLHIGKYSLKLMHTPGHTAGQTAVNIPEEKVVFTDDNVMGELSTPIHDARPDKLPESLKRVQDIDLMPTSRGPPK